MSTTVVAEIGQAHNGSVESARDMVYRVANPVDPERDLERVPWRADAVKTTKRDLDRELSEGNRPGQTRHRYTDPEKSFAYDTGTYAEHRERLELSWHDHHGLSNYAHDLGLDFIITLCSPSLVGELPMRPDYLKVASRDLTHIPLLEEMARTRIPMILSTGMARREDLDRALEAIEAQGGIVDTIMHCVSTYPCPFEDANLLTIPWLTDRYGDDYRIGYSDHTQGVQAGAWAVMLGAEIVEAHVTPSRVLRGGDHACSLSLAHGFWRYVRNIRHAERALGEGGMTVPDSVDEAREKLERSLCAADDLEPGTTLGSSNTTLLSPGTGLGWPERDELFGRTLREPVEAKTVLSSTMVG